MLALYRSGRQAEALQAYRELRVRLVEDLGVDPSPALHELYGRILRQEPALSHVPTREPRTNLPAEPTPFVGRAAELAEVVALLRRVDVRLVTVRGPCGAGKTRLAVRAAEEIAAGYADGVWWVPLAPLREPALVLEAIAQTLGAPKQQSLARHIADKRALVVLDNFEHLLDAAPAVADLLVACRHVTVIATSREPLHIAAEHEYLVPTLAETEAVELFRQRAYTAEPESAVLAICRRLDCLPLAIELAAARTKLLAPKMLLVRLEQRLPLLTGGPRDAPERQRTLEATIAWSYDLLTDKHRRLFARLAVFAGGFTLDAAARVCEADLDTLQALLDKNLIHREGARYQMLETIREFAGERLRDSGEAKALRRRHALHYLRLANTVRDPPDTGAMPSKLLSQFGMRAVQLERLHAAFPGDGANFRAAIAWGLQWDPTTFAPLWRRASPKQ
jgi:predicted ATPase